VGHPSGAARLESILLFFNHLISKSIVSRDCCDRDAAWWIDLGRDAAYRAYSLRFDGHLWPSVDGGEGWSTHRGCFTEEGTAAEAWLVATI